MRWKPIPGWAGLYEVSDAGQVRSLDRDTFRFSKGRVLKTAISNRGYLKVTCADRKRRAEVYIHQAVAYAFIGPRPKGKEVCHNDGVKENNRLANIRYDTALANIQDRERHRRRRKR